jgi:hypothetical protein
MADAPAGRVVERFGNGEVRRGLDRSEQAVVLWSS